MKYKDYNLNDESLDAKEIVIKRKGRITGCKRWTIESWKDESLDAKDRSISSWKDESLDVIFFVFHDDNCGMGCLMDKEN